MPAGRPNVIDSHDSKMLIVKALMTKQSHAKISREYGVSLDALRRYRKNELRRYIVNGINPMRAEESVVQAEQDKATRDFVMSDITTIRDNGHKVLKALIDGMPESGRLDCDPKAAAAVMREIRGNAELQARLEGRLQDAGRVQVNVVVLTSHDAPGSQPGPLLHENPLPASDDTIDAETFEIPPGS